MILAANDVADAQVGVIRTGGQMIGWHSIAAQQREVFDLIRQLGLLAVHQVDKAQHAVLTARHAETQGERFTGGGAAVALFARELAHSRIEQPGSLVPG